MENEFSIPWEYQTTTTKRKLVEIVELEGRRIKIYGPDKKPGFNIKISTSANAIDIRIERIPSNNEG